MKRKAFSLKKIGICGHFNGNAMTSSGQTIKTRIIRDELINQLGREQVITVDSHGGVREVIRMLIQSWKMFKQCENIIFLPAYEGLRVFAPVYTFYNKFFHRKIHYVVIGGWLNSFLDHHKCLLRMLNNFDTICVETSMMKRDLETRGFTNVIVMPNFKNLEILKPEELSYSVEPPYRLCTFSRVSKEKGIEDAIIAVKSFNESKGKVVYTLDIYGQPDDAYKDRFESIKKDFPSYIRYMGLVPSDQSVEIIKQYFALLFPTYYHGEGFAGTLIDAMAAGTPVIASDWRFNKEIVKPGKTGVLIRDCNAQKIEDVLTKISLDPMSWNKMKESSLKEAFKYKPEIAIKPLIMRL